MLPLRKRHELRDGLPTVPERLELEFSLGQLQSGFFQQRAFLFDPGQFFFMIDRMAAGRAARE